MLEDRSGGTIPFLAGQLKTFLAAAQKRPEIESISSTFNSDVPQRFVHVDKERVMKQGVQLGQLYDTIQTFMGGSFINYFNRFGRQWQVYIQAEGPFRTNAAYLGSFYVRNNTGDPVPLAGLTNVTDTWGPGVHDAVQSLPLGADQRVCQGRP